MALAMSVLLAPVALRADEAENAFIPSGGEDVVRLDDGRTLRCKVGAKEGTSVRLEFAEGSVAVPSGRVARVLLFRDYDPAPRDAAEKEKASRGLVRWAGSWLTPVRAAELRTTFLAAENQARSQSRPAPDWARHTRLEAGKFVIESDLPPPRIREYADLLQKYLECLRTHLQLALDDSTENGSIRITIYRNREDFDATKKADGVESEHAVGYYKPGKRRGQATINLFDFQGDRDMTLDVLLHEATHMFLHSATAGRNDRLATWLDEGLAEYMGGSTWKYGKFLPGALQEGRLLWFQEMIEQGRVLPLDRLVRTVPWDPRDDPNLEKGTFDLDEYAESWSFVHFLLHGRQGAYRGALRDYLKTGQYTEGVAYLLRRLERKDFQKIQQELVDYAKGLKLPGGKAYAERALRRVREEQPAGAEADLARAIAGAGTEQRTLVLAARTTHELERDGQAADLYARALAVDPLDSGLRMERAWCLTGSDGLRETRMAVALAPEDDQVLSQAAQRLIALGADGGEGLPDRAELSKEAQGYAARSGRTAKDGGAGGAAMAAIAAITRGDVEGARAMLALHKGPDTAPTAGIGAALEALAGNASGAAERLAAFRTALRARGAGARPAGPTWAPVVPGAREVAEAVSIAGALSAEQGRQEPMARALDELYAKEAPATDQEWVVWAGLSMEGVGPERAVELVTAGLKAFPRSDDLARIRKMLDD